MSVSARTLRVGEHQSQPCEIGDKAFAQLHKAVGLILRTASVLITAGWLSAPVNAATTGADAVVLVNSASSRHLDFRNYIQPYLDNFGVPYSVLDIQTNAVGTNIGSYALVIIGHSQFDTNHAYFSLASQANLTAAISNGTGLVNFDGALSGGGVVTNYPYVQTLFGFSYSNNAAVTSVTFPATQTNSQLHYIAVLHATNETISLRSNLVIAGLIPPANVMPVVLSGGKPLVAISKPGLGRAVQWAGYDWMSVAVKGPVSGMDDLVWRSLVWASRKPFVMRGMPNLVTMRTDDVAGPLWWVHAANEMGFKPWLGIFYYCFTEANALDLHDLTVAGNATASVHSHSCGGGTQFFYYDYFNNTAWSDNVISNNFFVATRWLTNHGIASSKVVILHYSEIGLNALAGLKTWGVEFLPNEIKLGDAFSTTTPWTIAGPYRLYENPGTGTSLLPFFYADFWSVTGHPEFDGQFFNCFTEIRDDSACGEWCPDNDVAGSIARGTRHLKRAFDSMALATLFTHEFKIHPTPDNPNGTAITTNNWRAILQGITNNIGNYQPQYVTLDYACQYVRATRTAKISSAQYDPDSGSINVALSGKADLNLSLQVYLGSDNSISNLTVTVPAFTNTVSISAPILGVPPILAAEAQGNSFRISFNTMPGHNYAVEYKDSLSAISWLPLTNITALDTNLTFTEAIDNANRFYRVRTPAN